MRTYFKVLIFPDVRTAIILTIILTLSICAGTLTPLTENIDAPGSDKWHHFIAFAGLVYPITAASRSYWIPIIIFGASLGALIEIIQPFVNRLGDIQDFRADALGVLIGFAVGVAVFQFKIRHIDNKCQLV